MTKSVIVCWSLFVRQRYWQLHFMSLPLYSLFETFVNSNKTLKSNLIFRLRINLMYTIPISSYITHVDTHSLIYNAHLNPCKSSLKFTSFRVLSSPQKKLFPPVSKGRSSNWLTKQFLYLTCKLFIELMEVLQTTDIERNGYRLRWSARLMSMLTHHLISFDYILGFLNKIFWKMAVSITEQLTPPHGTTYPMCGVSWAVWPKLFGLEFLSQWTFCNGHKWILLRVFCRPTVAVSPSDECVRMSHSDISHDAPE